MAMFGKLITTDPQSGQNYIKAAAAAAAVAALGP